MAWRKVQEVNIRVCECVHVCDFEWPCVPGRLWRVNFALRTIGSH